MCTLTYCLPLKTLPITSLTFQNVRHRLRILLIFPLTLPFPCHAVPRPSPLHHITSQPAEKSLAPTEKHFQAISQPCHTIPYYSPPKQLGTITQTLKPRLSLKHENESETATATPNMTHSKQFRNLNPNLTRILSAQHSTRIHSRSDSSHTACKH